MFWRIIMFLLLVVFAIVAFSKSSLMAAAPYGGQMPPSVVELQTVETTQWKRQLHTTGTVEALDFTVITPDVPGIISRLNFRSGRPVKKGDVLFELDATLERAQLGSLQADVDLAQRELKRAAELYRRKAIARADYDRATSKSKQTRAALASAKAVVAKKTYHAPFDGITGISTTDIGEYFNPGDPVVTLSAIDTVLVGFYVPEQQVSKLEEGQQFTLTTSAYPGETFTGTVQAIEPRIDTRTRNVALIGSAENKDHRLRPGMFANITLTLGGTDEYTVVPRTAVSFNPFGNIVYVAEPRERQQQQTSSELAFKLAWPPIYRKTTVTGETTVSELGANQRFVQTGEARGELIAIKKGLTPGDRIVIAGQQKLYNGAAVTEPQPDATAQPGAAGAADATAPNATASE